MLVGAVCDGGKGKKGKSKSTGDKGKGKGNGKDKNKHKSNDGGRDQGTGLLEQWSATSAIPGLLLTSLEVGPQTRRLSDSIGSTEKWCSGWR